ncbi:MAG TPA: class I SAM-dependent methyltransferase [Candidatus Paceibacterota bacterium]|nr:class I SAM-dependent methyltransferase [Candidatus Paceibacterota bacterium]
MFTDPEKNLRAFGIREDMIVADLGAGTGFYSLLIAPLLLRGKVYAVEIQKDFLAEIKNKALSQKCRNLECLWGDVERPGGTKLASELVDAAIASNVLFQVENKDRFIEEAKRILKPGGKLLFIDWSPEQNAFGSKLKGAVSKTSALKMFERKGFKLVREINAGEHHYGMILEKERENKSKE